MESIGHIKLHRGLLDSQVFAHQTALKIWIWCLLKATYKERHVSLKIGKGSTTVTIYPGQFIFGRFKAEEELGIDGSTIYKWIQKFASDAYDNMLSINSNNQYSIISITKWDDYQAVDGAEEQPKNNQRTTKEQPKNNQGTQTRIVKNSKESKEVSKANRFSPPSVLEVQSYISEKGYKVDAEAFVAYYASKGWKVGNTPMKDWRMAVVTWSKRNNELKAQNNGNRHREVPCIPWEDRGSSTL